jgi:hypothetical protein
MKIFIFKSIVVFIITYALFQVTFFSQFKKLKHSIDNLKEKETRIVFKEKLLSEIKEANNKEFYFTVEERLILSKFLNKILIELDLK